MAFKVEFDSGVLDLVVDLAKRVRSAGGRALCVGGCVRDGVMGVESKDVDIEVYGLEGEVLEKLLKKEYGVIKVGKSFGVYKLRGYPIDVAIPRTESKVGEGHRGFEVRGDPKMSPEEAALRRDFTMNAMMWDPLSGELMDPYGGVGDIGEGVLRHVSEKFVEDPLRVLRGMQFAARFGMDVAGATVELCKAMTMEGLSRERIFEEWSKFLLKGVDMRCGLEFLRDCGWVRYFPELEALIGCEQDKEWHPEGDVWEHTINCLDTYAGQRLGEDFEDLVVGFAVLCHDMGKPLTTFEDEAGRVRSPRHEKEGVPVAEAFLRRMTAHADLIESVLPLVEAHMRPLALVRDRSRDSAIRRLALEVRRMDRLIRVVSADMGGKGTEPDPSYEEGIAWLWERLGALELEDNAPKPIVKGRHLIDMGYEPGGYFGPILDACFDAQLEGEFADETGGLEYLRGYLKKNSPDGAGE